MDFSDDALRLLAQRLVGTNPASRRDRLEEALVPMIRCVLRTGRGSPPLVQWVKRHLPAVAGAAPDERPANPESAARPMARLLSGRLMQQLQAQPALVAGHDTIMGR
jgi:hypothetical protein